MSEDPIGFAGGDANLYAYVGNSPGNYIDPFGESGAVAIPGGVGGILESAGSTISGGVARIAAGASSVAAAASAVASGATLVGTGTLVAAGASVVVAAAAVWTLIETASRKPGTASATVAGQSTITRTSPWDRPWKDSPSAAGHRGIVNRIATVRGKPPGWCRRHLVRCGTYFGLGPVALAQLLHTWFSPDN